MSLVYKPQHMHLIVVDTNQSHVLFNCIFAGSLDAIFGYQHLVLCITVMNIEVCLVCGVGITEQRSVIALLSSFSITVEMSRMRKH